jgi:hypothetical protein
MPERLWYLIYWRPLSCSLAIAAILASFGLSLKTFAVSRITQAVDKRRTPFAANVFESCDQSGCGECMLIISI